MSDEQEREDRKVLITKALLLGYTFITLRGDFTHGPYLAITPEGKTVGFWYNTRWDAARAALIHAGAIPDGR